MDDEMNMWNSLLRKVRRNWRPLLLIAFLLFAPFTYFVLTDHRFSVWVSPLPASIVPTYELTIDTVPEVPVVEGTLIEVTVANLTDYPESNATIFVIEGDGTTLYYLVTGQSGLASFEYPGHPVIVYAEKDDIESRKIIVGQVPFEWFLALSLSLLGWIPFMLLVVVATRRIRYLDIRIEELEAGFQEHRKRILSVRNISDLR